MDKDAYDAQLKWHHLVTFREVATEGSFTKAARNLYLSQPAVSAQIRGLEKYFGVRLFDRMGRKSFLTPDGKVLLEYAQRMITLAHEAHQALDALRGLKRGKLAIGASLLVGSYMLPAILGDFQQKHPGIDVELIIRYAPEVARLVAENLVDFGLVGSPVLHGRLFIDPILADELVVIVPKDHRLADGREIITPFEFCSYPAVFTEVGSSTRRIALQKLSQRDLTPQIVLELGHTEAVKRSVEAGIGISIISSHAVRTEVETGRLVSLRLEGVDLRRHINLLYHRDKTPSDAAEAFLRTLQKRWGCSLKVLNNKTHN